MTETKTQPWTVKDGKVLSLTGEWWTPKELLLEVKKTILAAPNRYDQEDSGSMGLVLTDDGRPQRDECGTVSCIGGWGEYLTTGQLNAMTLTMVGQFLGYRATAGRDAWPWLFQSDFLGADLLGADPLESYEDWEKHGALSSRYDRATSNAERAQVAADAIDMYIQEKGW